MRTLNPHLQVTLQAIYVACWSIWMDWWLSGPRLTDTLRGMAGVACRLWADYRSERAQQRAFERRFPIQREERFDEAESPLFIAALVIVAVLAYASFLFE
ncbi:MAG: hypothetical protein KIT35_21910 [Piscinibacter sp.]|uniref:hypothetical protein n=1 Tax=Piscinibacter sp. TaxID=1903157 RepID=UPI002590230A|nr:hypothetical protein [Piscinibacter sp.]MCW5666496.1 hypothetical protein [Piscinibacter sp.]